MFIGFANYLSCRWRAIHATQDSLFLGGSVRSCWNHCDIRRTRTEEVIDLCDGRNRAYSSERRTAAKCHAIIKGSET